MYPSDRLPPIMHAPPNKAQNPPLLPQPTMQSPSAHAETIEPCTLDTDKIYLFLCSQSSIRRNARPSTKRIPVFPFQVFVQRLGCMILGYIPDTSYLPIQNLRSAHGTQQGPHISTHNLQPKAERNAQPLRWTFPLFLAPSIFTPLSPSPIVFCKGQHARSLPLFLPVILSINLSRKPDSVYMKRLAHHPHLHLQGPYLIFCHTRTAEQKRFCIFIQALTPFHPCFLPHINAIITLAYHTHHARAPQSKHLLSKQV